MVYRGQTVHYLKWDPHEHVEEEDVFDIGDATRAVRLIDWFVKGYYFGSSSRRKRDAKALAEMCATVHRPRFDRE